jgi:hypothetical protein
MKQFQPVVILGPGRGGTTLLYKLLALHPRAAFVSSFDVHPLTRLISGPLVSLIRRALPLKRASWFGSDGQAYLTRRRLPNRLVPTPVEGEEIYTRCGLTLSEQVSSPDSATLGRLRRVFWQIQRRQGGDVLFLKRTANNRRIPALLSAFPECKFLILWRDGRAVTTSLMTVDWWLDHKVWWADDQTPREMNLDRAGMVELAARNWTMEVKAICRGLKDVSSGRQFHLRYEDLIVHPESHLTEALNFVGLSPTTEYRNVIHSLALGPRQESWRTKLSESEQVLIAQIAGDHLISLGYECPTWHAATS